MLMTPQLVSTVRRFQTTFLGSRAIVGTLLKPQNLLLSRDTDGRTLADVLGMHGFAATEKALTAPRLQAEQVSATHKPLCIDLNTQLHLS